MKDAQAQGQPQQPKPAAPQQQTAPEKRGTEQAPFVVKIQEADKTQEKLETTTPKSPKQGGESWFSGWSLSDKIAAVLAFVGFLQLVALVATVEVARRTATRQLRAYACLEGGSVKPKELEDGKVLLDGFVRLKNFGQTPAKDFRSWVAMRVQNASDWPFDQISEGLGKAIMSPQGEANLPVRLTVTKQTLDEIRKGTKRIFVWGGCDYTDVFGKNRYLKFYMWNNPEISSGWPLGSSDKGDEAN
jgi:hypothetical protein